jgi:hypothetical protein
VRVNLNLQQVSQIRAALEEQGIEFTPATETHGAGVRWRSSPSTLPLGGAKNG